MKHTVLTAVLALGVAMSGTLPEGASADTLKIGLIGPLTGGGAPWGIAAEEAMKIAADDANKGGGLEVGNKKYQVEVVSYDDNYKASDALAAYNRLVKQDNVKYILTVASPSTLAIGQNVEDDKVILITSAAVEKAVETTSKWKFRIISMMSQYVPAVIRWVATNIKAKTVAIVNPNDESGWSATNITEEAYKKNGISVIDKELYERSLKDFAPLMTRIISMKPDIIDLASTAPATAGLIVRQARDLGYKGIFVKNSAGAAKEIIDAAGVDGAEGVVEMQWADADSDGFKRLAAAYRKAHSQEPNESIATYFDATSAMLRAIQLGGDVNDTAKVSDAMLHKVFPYPSVVGGDLQIGGSAPPNNFITFSFVSVIRNGKAVVVGKVQ